MPKKPYKKILLITADQLRADCVFPIGRHQVKTPNLDQLKKEAVSFLNHYTVSVPCGPARASLLTGLYAMNHRAIRNGSPLDYRLPNIAKMVRQIGIEPLLLGYTDTAPDPRKYANLQDPVFHIYHYEGIMEGFTPICPEESSKFWNWRSYLKNKGYGLFSSVNQVFTPKLSQKPTVSDPAIFCAEDSDTAFLTDQCISTMENRSEQSWLIHLSYYKPHPPWIAPEPYNSMYCADDMSLAKVTKDGNMHPFLQGELSSSCKSFFVGAPDASQDLTTQQQKQAQAVYYGLVSEMDHHLGRLIDYLKESGQYDDTLIIFTSDHGEMLGDHYLLGKNNFFKGSFHVPLLIRHPSLPQSHGHCVDALTESVDIVPTLLNCLDLEIHNSIDGKSLFPFLTNNPPQQWRTYLYQEMDYGDLEDRFFEQYLNLESSLCNLCIIQSKQYKYVHFNGKLPSLLFDLQNDSDELKNLAQEKEYQSLVLELNSQLLNHRMTYGDRQLSTFQFQEAGVFQDKKALPML